MTLQMIIEYAFSALVLISAVLIMISLARTNAPKEAEITKLTLENEVLTLENLELRNSL